MVLFYYPESSVADMMVNCLVLTLIHSTRDMSVANSTKIIDFYTYNELKGLEGKEDISLMSKCPPCRVVSVSEDTIVVSWCRQYYTIGLGETAETEEYAIDNPYLSWEGVSMKMKYEKHLLLETIVSAFDDVSQLHRDVPYRIGDNVRQKEKCLKFLRELIYAGGEYAKPLYAWFASSDNWDTLIITDLTRFKNILSSLPSTNADYLNTWLYNFAQIFRYNELNTVLYSFHAMRKFLKKIAHKYEKAYEILNGKIEP